MNKHLTKYDWIALSVFLVVLTLIAAWTIDVSVSALLTGGILTNGFIFNSPAKMYHISLYIIIIVSFSNFLILLHITSTYSKKKPEND
jgi:hypothetical protein